MRYLKFITVLAMLCIACAGIDSASVAECGTRTGLLRWSGARLPGLTKSASIRRRGDEARVALQLDEVAAGALRGARGGVGFGSGNEAPPPQPSPASRERGVFGIA